MRFGLAQETIEKINKVLSRFPEVKKAVIYGSRAKGNFKPTSDIDLALFGECLNPDIRTSIALELDDLLLPWEIDLCLFATLNHVELEDHIRRVGQVVYETGPVETQA